MCYGQLTVIVQQIPSNTPPNAEIYIAGNFNNWNPGSTAYQLQREETRYIIDLNIPSGSLQFKFTRGSWASVEGNQNGGFIPNRNYNYTGGKDTLRLNILGWEDLGGSNPSTATSSVSIITDSFYMPEFNRYRRVWIYLPPDYMENPERRYHVLYMHDGQNLFDRNTSFAGEWRVDESLDSLQKQGFDVGIVVGINNGGSHRIAEYTPWSHPTHGGGDGDKYIQFIKNTLKPYIDQNYRTKPDAINTGIMGSSLGGLISMYAGLQYPNDFTRIGAFSSSFWFSSNIYTLASDAEYRDDHRYYLIAGSNEGGNQVADMNAMVAIKNQKGYGTDQLFSEAHQGATHSEWYWAREFPKAYKFLFSTVSNTNEELEPVKDFKLRQTPGTLWIGELNGDRAEEYLLLVSDSSGRQVIRQYFKGELEVKTHTWSAGIYVINISNTKGILRSFRIFKGE